MSNNTSRKTAKRAITNTKTNISRLQQKLGATVLFFVVITLTLFYAYAINGFLFVSAIVVATGTIFASYQVVRITKSLRYERDRLSSLKKVRKALKS